MYDIWSFYALWICFQCSSLLYIVYALCFVQAKRYQILYMFFSTFVRQDFGADRIGWVYKICLLQVCWSYIDCCALDLLVSDLFVGLINLFAKSDCWFSWFWLLYLFALVCFVGFCLCQLVVRQLCWLYKVCCLFYWFVDFVGFFVCWSGLFVAYMFVLYVLVCESLK